MSNNMYLLFSTLLPLAAFVPFTAEICVPVIAGRFNAPSGLVVPEPVSHVAVAPMAGGTYKIGDSFIVSLIFDEIVESTNSGTLSRVKVNTSWGTASYVGGANTNVLYFKGTVANNASGKLTVNGFTNPSYIKDMCDVTTTKDNKRHGYHNCNR